VVLVGFPMSVSVAAGAVDDVVMTGVAVEKMTDVVIDRVFVWGVLVDNTDEVVRLKP